MPSNNATAATFNLDDVSGKFQDESDRACVALAAAELHAELDSLFKRHLDADHQLLEDGQPLGAFSTRTRLARALGWIDDEIRHDLDLVRNIIEAMLELDGRLPFKYFQIAEWCGMLKVGEKFFGGPEVDGLDFCDGLNPTPLPVDDRAAVAARRRFEVTVELLAKHLKGLPEYH